MGSKSYITASDLLNFAKCNHKPYMDRYGDPALKIDVHSLIKMLWESGVQYEAEIIAWFKAQHTDKVFVTIDPNQPASLALFEETKAAMASGADYIYQGVLIADDCLGRPDLLQKLPGKSSFGAYCYAPMDIKLARSDETWEDGKDKIPPEHHWQLLFYGQLLEKVQGAMPNTGKIFKSPARMPPVNLQKPNEKVYKNYKHALRRLTTYQTSNDCDSVPALASNCKLCEWQEACEKQVLDTNDCTQVYRVGQKLQQGLRTFGVVTVDDLTTQDPEQLKTKVREGKKNGLFWPSCSDNDVDNAIRRAKILKSGTPVFHEKIDFLDHPIEIHYDIEDDSTRDFVYLHGLLVVEQNKEPVFHALFADRPEDEERISHELFDFLNRYVGAPVYHYHHHEKTVLGRLVQKYPSLDSSVYDGLFGVDGTAIDLCRIIEKRTDWPLPSYGLKPICRYLGFEWRADDASGSGSVVWINDYLKGNKAMKEKLLRYNEDDCRATLFLKQQLQIMQRKSFDS